ncbi:MAG: glycosyltransferase, partial [Acidobacteria bacterium]|nr:glycosyltransferase [Acidobacteriota bacterium]
MSTEIPTLGVVAIAKNEEEDMPRFLELLLPWVNEIVVVDDNSADATLEIVKAAGAKVKLIEHRMEDELGFAGQRNLGIEE